MSASTLEIKLLMTGLAQVNSQLTQLSNSVSRQMMSLKGFAIGVGGTMAAALGISKVTEGFKDIIELGGKLNDLQLKTGVAAKDMLRLQQAFKDSGLEASDASGAVNKLQKAIYSARDGAGDAAKVFRDMGLDVQALLKMDAVQQFDAVSNSIRNIGSQVQRVAAARELFGKSGASLLQVMMDPTALKTASDSLGMLPEIMQRNLGTLDRMGDALGRVSIRGRQLFAGMFDIIGEKLAEQFEKIDKIDLTRIGQKIGAFVEMIANAWRDGKLSELIALLIEAGFEMGGKLATKAWDFITQGFRKSTSTSIGMGLLDAIATYGVKFAQMMIEILKLPITTLVGGFSYAVDQFVFLLQTKANTVINGLIKAFNFTHPLAPAFPTIPGASKTDRPASFNEHMDQAASTMLASTESLNKSLSDQLKTLRDIIGATGKITDSDNKDLSALDRINKLLDNIVAKRNAAGGANPPPASGSIGHSESYNLKEEERALSAKLLQVEKDRAKIEANFSMTSAEKYPERLKLLDKELMLITEQVLVMRRRAEFESDPQTKEKLEDDLKRNEHSKFSKEKEIMGMGADPNSFSQQFRSTITELRNEWGTLATQMASSFKSVFNGAISSISNGITGLIRGTMTWGQALASIGDQILTSIVGAIVQMGVRWMLTQLLMFAFGKGLQAAAVATALPFALSATSMWATPALLANTATFGGAGITGAGMLAGTALTNMGTMAAMTAGGGGMKEGGYTGNGGVDQFAGFVHGQEFVMPAGPTREYRPLLEAMRAGASVAPPAAVSPNITNKNNVNIAMFDDKSSMAAWLKSADGEAIIVDMVRMNMHNLA